MRPTGLPASRLVFVLVLLLAGLVLGASGVHGEEGPPDDTTPEEPPSEEPEPTTTTTTDPETTSTTAPEPEPEPGEDDDDPDGDDGDRDDGEGNRDDDEGLGGGGGSGDDGAPTSGDATPSGPAVGGWWMGRPLDEPGERVEAAAAEPDDAEAEAEEPKVAGTTASAGRVRAARTGERVPFVADLDDDPVGERPDRVVEPSSLDGLFEQAGAATALGVGVSAAVAGVGVWLARRRLARA